ncbi:hypothetical protein Q5424_25920 [Conexibacter sp. JD483]|uniref:hypothetical protein n=1 Tax=unclassified Conexibacter TaxID=2627773 RepID=UPI002716E7C6|nr:MULTISPECIES: hypothetical protein [unclassified Conexibacter]MDO8187785.1 hypothetical protein [Conexibacter sp. CPCC 205706]MDO8201973.1 hypothetical protein [Conexibacter sp. CPCC 205762]MDR9372563.1 hypothetical protein [Conexibacter sp. JD483]
MTESRPTRRVALLAMPLAAVAAAAAAVTPAAATAAGKDVTARVAFDYSLDFHHTSERSFGGQANEAVDLRYHLDGALPAVTFSGENSVILHDTMTAPINAAVQATFSHRTTVSDGTLNMCRGGPLIAGGAATVALGGGGGFRAHFAPYTSGSVAGACVDGTGAPGTIDWPLPTMIPPGPSGDGLPLEGTDVTPTIAELTSAERWTRRVYVLLPFRSCPGWDPATISCGLEIRGTVTAVVQQRTIRDATSEEDFLDPAQTRQPPRLDRSKRSVGARVGCPRRCSAQIEIGVFGRRRGKPYVRRYTASRSAVTIPAGGVRALRAPVPAAARVAVAAGSGVARVTVRVGGRRVEHDYPLGGGR